MRQIRECLRLCLDKNLSQKQVARALNLGRATVQTYLAQVTKAGLSWQEIQTLDDSQLSAIIYEPDIANGKESRINALDFPSIYRELRRPGVTRELLWKEYIAFNPAGYSYSRFCALFKEWQKGLKTYMHVEHKGGEKTFVDYSGKKFPIYDIATGKVDREAEIFVMCWGASQYTYVEAQNSQQQEDWIMGHARGFDYFEAVSSVVVPDNLKSAVTRSCRYDPDINRSYQEFSEHYNCAIIPARPGKPKDKGKVENAVQLVQRWILAPLRDRRFYSLEELNSAIRELLEELNNRLIKQLGRSRKELFLELDKPNALPLPTQQYQYAQWYYPTVAPDYHVQVENDFYSVPWQYHGKDIAVRIQGNQVEIFEGTQRLCSHVKGNAKWKHITTINHLPEAHRNVKLLSMESLIFKARRFGSNTEQLIRKIIESKIHPLQGYRPAQGILREGAKHSPEVLEAVASVALSTGATRVQEIRKLITIYQKQRKKETIKTVCNSSNARGADYYNE